MALETIKRRVCDVCGSDNDVMRVRISLLNERTHTSTVDVCAEHRQPVTEVMNAKPTGVRKRRQVTPKKEVKKRAKVRA